MARAKQDAEQLVNAMLPLAEKMLFNTVNSIRSTDI